MTVTEQAYQQFQEALKRHNPDADLKLIEKAYTLALNAHKTQLRQSGEPYIIHPIHVATNLANLNMDSQAIAAGFLHDVIEDTEITDDELKAEFGQTVYDLVDGVSKLRQIKFREESLYIENLRKMMIATAKDIRVIIIRLCDRLHNMQTLQYLATKEQHRLARETLEIYAPIADRLQIGRLRGELEDWSFKTLHPEEYRWLYNVTRKNFQDRERKLQEMKKTISSMLSDEGIELVSLQKRLKFIYSLHKKLQRYDNDLSRIYDIIAIRVIVPKVADCYAAMGMIHREYKPLKGRIKDYIARPKSNGYSSLHTTVMLPDGDLVEVQIRTPEMHDKAEYGIAAHWQYKENGVFTKREMQVSWVKELAKILQEIKDPKDLEHIKLDLFKHRIFVLTPKGDVIDLPEDSTPVDFAYAIHTEIGNQTARAKVNGTDAPLSTKLQNGDIVDISVDKKRKGPDKEWLNFVKTHLATSKIKHFHRKKMSLWGKALGKK